MAAQPTHKAFRLLAAQGVPLESLVVVQDMVHVVNGVEALNAALKPPFSSFSLVEQDGHTLADHLLAVLALGLCEGGGRACTRRGVGMEGLVAEEGSEEPSSPRRWTRLT